jgi:pseudomonalisin
MFGTASSPVGASSLRAVARPLAGGPSAGVVGAVNDAVMVGLPGDLPPALATSRDQGKLADNVFLPHISLGLKRPAASQAALDELAVDQQIRGSAVYHKWLQPAALSSYGPAHADIAKVVAWLQRHGLTVNSVSPSGMSIDFAGRSGLVAAAFHTQIHNVARSGQAYVSAIAPPEIAAALAPVVKGVTLSNFFPTPSLVKATPSFTFPSPYGTFYAVAPADFATIYNVNPLRGNNNAYGAPITGTGVTIAVVEQTQISSADWTKFRSVFGLSGFSGTLVSDHPGNCTAPGFTGDEVEAAIDAEWSSAVAPAATIVEASCSGTSPFEFGVMTTLQGLVENPTPATIFSISYEGQEDEDGVTFQAAWTNLVEEAAAEGKSVFVAAGDNGTSVDRGEIDSLGLFVNGFADTAYNTSVGGTDFYDTALGENSTYWKTSNGTGLESALSYVPEIPWDNSCASSILAKYLGYSGPNAFCNSSKNISGVQEGVGGSGSQSEYYEKPSWQTTSSLGFGNDGVRDQPDVSLFAANGIWNHFYVICMSNANEGGAPCEYSNYKQVFPNAYGGTSFGAPAFAGIMALIQETTSGSTGQGNAAPALYQTAVNQYDLPLLDKNCNSTLGNAISAACVFNYITAGDNAEPCYSGTANCVTDSASKLGIGLLESSGRVDYPARIGYNLATGLGTVNVTNLLYSYYPYPASSK